MKIRNIAIFMVMSIAVQHTSIVMCFDTHTLVQQLTEKLAEVKKQVKFMLTPEGFSSPQAQKVKGIIISALALLNGILVIHYLSKADARARARAEASSPAFSAAERGEQLEDIIAQLKQEIQELEGQPEQKWLLDQKKVLFKVAEEGLKPRQKK